MMIAKYNQLFGRIFHLIPAFLFIISGCHDNRIVDPPSSFDRGDIISSTTLGQYSPDVIQQILIGMNAALPYSLTDTVEVVSVEYITVDGGNNEEHASGALMIPLNKSNPYALVSLQHGTETKRDLVASQSPLNSVEGIVGMVLASMGYVTVVPDYLGFGASNIMHPYLHAESLVPCVVDLMRATRTYCAHNGTSLDGRIFLTGYSEGGYVTLATQKTVEQDYSDEFNLTAVAPMAGPYDLHGMMLSMFQQGEYSTPAYIAFFLTAYNEVYKWNRLSEIFRAPYASRMSGLFDGSKTWGQVISQLPATFSELMNASFVANVILGNEPGVVQAIQENTLLNWTPKTPIHFFHGDADDVVPYQNAITAVDSLRANGATEIQLTTIQGGNHDTSSLPSVLGVIGWFEEIRGNNQKIVYRNP
ncbi:MAG: alpha/beta hydrolase [bacterium]|nr:MAG: alpha/beta hydrolase [bacterium]